MCPEFLHFDQSLGLCNWPKLAGCKNQRLSKDENYAKAKYLRDGKIQFCFICLICYKVSRPLAGVDELKLEFKIYTFRLVEEKRQI